MGACDEVVVVGEHGHRVDLDRSGGIVAQAIQRFDEAIHTAKLDGDAGSARNAVAELWADVLADCADVVAIESVERCEVRRRVGVDVGHRERRPLWSCPPVGCPAAPPYGFAPSDAVTGTCTTSSWRQRPVVTGCGGSQGTLAAGNASWPAGSGGYGTAMDSPTSRLPTFWTAPDDCAAKTGAVPRATRSGPGLRRVVSRSAQLGVV